MSASTRTAFYLGQSYTENMAVFKNMQFDEIKNFFSITQRLVLENVAEAKSVRVMDSSDPSWVKTKISHPQVMKWTKTKIHVYPDSVLCLGKINEPAESMERWTGQLKDLQSTVSIQEFDGIDGEPIELEWNTFPGLTSLESLREIQENLQHRNTVPDKFEDRIIFMSMCNDID